VSEVSFYHLQRQSLEQALPRLLGRVLDAGLRAVVVAGSEERVDALNTLLWTYDPASFLPHGGPRDGNGELQPVYLTWHEENPGNAEVLVLVDGVPAFDLDQFSRCLELFDGRDEAAVTRARTRWKDYQAAGHRVTYWRQSDSGKWEKAG